MKTFVESEFEVMYVYYFQTKADSYEDISSASVSSYVSWWVSNKRELLQRHRSQFEVPEVYEFQTKANSSEDICWVSV